MKPIAMQMRQTAPGRYVGAFPADAPGNFFVNVVPQAGIAPLTTGVSVPYSDEYRLRDLNEPLLRSLASTTPVGGLAGEILAPLSAEVIRLAGQANPFRVGLSSDRSIRDIWPWAVLIACCLFLVDIFARRVSVSFGWIQNAWSSCRGYQVDPVPAMQRLDTLRAAKQSVARSRETNIGRYESTPAGVPSSEKSFVMQPQKPATFDSDHSDEESQSYTQRLLNAKRSAKR